MNSQKKLPKLLTLLSGFTLSDFIKFSKFVNSPYFNESPLSVHLFEYLFIAAKKGTLNEISQQMMYTELFPGETFSPPRIRQITTRLASLIESYYRQVNLEGMANFQQVFLIRELNRRSLASQFGSKLKEYEELKTKSHITDPYFLMGDLIIKYEAYRFQQASLDYKNSLNTIEGINEVAERLYLVVKLVAINMRLLNSLMTGQDMPIAETKIFLEEKRNVIFVYEEKYPGLVLLFKFAELLCFFNIDNTHKLIEFTQVNISKISYGILDMVYNSLFNYLYMHDILKNSAMTLIVLEDIEKIGTLGRRRIITPLQFLFLTKLISKSKSREHIEVQLEKFSLNLHSDYREYAYSISLAMIKMSIGEFQEALTILSPLPQSDSYTGLTVRLLILQIKYELKYLKHIKAEIDAVRHYIRRRTAIPLVILESVKTFLSYYNRLLSLAKKRSPDINLFLAEAESDEPCFSRDWIIKKALEIQGL